MPSRSVASTFRGASCLESVSYGFVHGPSPAVAQVTLSGRTSVQVGQEHAIRVDQSMFVGYVTNIAYSAESDSTTLRLVDWRDRMRDILIFAAWNMNEDGGLWYHIEEENWSTQTKTYVNARKLDAAQLHSVQAFPDAEMNDEVIFEHDNFKTSWSILNSMCRQQGIQLICDQNAQTRLQTTIPENVDANSGMYLADLIDYVTAKAACQFSCYGRNILHVTMRGMAQAGMSNLVRQSIANPCSTGANQFEIGQELNEQPRRVRLVGDQNQYEILFPLLADWNKNWQWDFVHNGPLFAALLRATGLTGQDQVKKLPEKYWDECYWPLDSFEERVRGAIPARRTRNDMTIDEYREKVPYKCYRVDPAWSAYGVDGAVDPQVAREKIRMRAIDADTLLLDEDKILKDETGKPLDAEFQGKSLLSYFTMNNDGFVVNAAGAFTPDPKAMQFNYPLAPQLLTNSQKQFTCYCSNQDIPEGWAFPFSKQLMMVPLESGVSLQVEECEVDDVDFRKRWIVRALFSQSQFYNDLELQFLHKKFVKPDRAVIRLSISREIYQFLKGEVGLNLRVRERKVPVRNLFRGFVQGEEIPVIRELKQQKGQFRDKIAKADEVADGIATKMLSNQPITVSGSMNFENRAGWIPDGLVDTVAVSFDQRDGIREQINFTTANNIDDSFVGPSRIRVQGNELLRNELISERLQLIGRQAMLFKDGVAKARAIAEHGLRTWGGFLGAAVADKAFGRDGIARASISKNAIENAIAFEQRQMIPAGQNVQ